MVAGLVLGQQHQVVARPVLLLVFHQTASFRVRGGLPSHVCLAAADGLENTGTGLRQLSLQLGTGGLVCHLGKLLLQLGDFIPRLAVLLVHIIEKLLDAEHVAVVGHGDGVHPVGQAFVHHTRDGGHSVLNGILRMDVKMSELCHSDRLTG